MAQVTIDLFRFADLEERGVERGAIYPAPSMLFLNLLPSWWESLWASVQVAFNECKLDRNDFVLRWSVEPVEVDEVTPAIWTIGGDSGGLAISTATIAALK